LDSSCIGKVNKFEDSSETSKRENNELQPESTQTSDRVQSEIYIFLPESWVFLPHI
jgi:hypothetical protein